MREAHLRVSLLDEYTGERYGAGTTISSPWIEAWEPVDVCDRNETALFLRLAGGKNAHTEESVRVVRKKRENYAKHLAEKLAAEIVKSMEANDTRNGYKP